MILNLSTFSGEIPRLPVHLLPPGAAQEAINCDFSHGELRALKGHYLLLTAANQPKGLYTPDGLRYFTWAEDVDAVKAPTIDDLYDRVYYTTASDFRVASAADATLTGGVPAHSYRVGVPRPAAASAVALTGTPCDSLALSFTFWYESGGKKYQSGTITPTLLETCKSWSFTPPARAPGTPDPNDPTKMVGATPENASPMVLIKAVGTGSVLVWQATPSGSAMESGGEYEALIGVNSDGAFTITLQGNNAVTETRAYAYTLVNTYGEEGAPSDPTLVTVPSGRNVSVTVTVPQAGEYAPISAVRLYRTATGSSGEADYQFVDEYAVTPGSVVLQDSTKSEALGESLATYGYLPPSPFLVGLCYIGNGVMAAFKGNEVQFCAAYRGYAWPPEYALTFPHNVVSIIPHGSGLVVTTTAHPYLISGVTPDAMTQTRIGIIQAGVGKRAITDTGNGIVYASHDGLVVVNGVSASLANSQQFFTRDDWRGRYGSRLSSLKLVTHDGFLIGYFEDADGFMIRLDEAAGTLTKFTGRYAAAFMLPQTDSVYFASGSAIYQFAGGNVGSFDWRSGDHVPPKPTNYAAGYFDGEGNITVQVYCDGELKHSVILTAPTAFRLPSGFLARRWSFRLSGTGVVRALHIAHSMAELASV